MGLPGRTLLSHAPLTRSSRPDSPPLSPLQTARRALRCAATASSVWLSCTCRTSSQVSRSSCSACYPCECADSRALSASSCWLASQPLQRPVGWQPLLRAGTLAVRAPHKHPRPAFPSAGESGGRADVRWLALGDDGGAAGGLLAAAAGAGESLQAAVSPFSVAAFEAARHDHELEPSGFTWVHLDHAHMGLGGDDSWSPTGDPPPRHRRCCCYLLSLPPHAPPSPCFLPLTGIKRQASPLPT
jgi:hypothetical protein